MKKMVIIIFVLLLLAGAGGGAYYYFFMMNENSHMAKTEEISVEESQALSVEAEPQIQPNMDYFVASNKLNVRAYPRLGAPIRLVLRKGTQIKALEIKDDWVRISDYEIHKSGNDIADWVHTDYLSHERPVITALELRKNMLKLVNKSDDFVLYQDQFVLATQKLIDEKTCSYEDFELMKGWVLSRSFNVDPVYFVYCGGTERENKVYVNVKTNEIFEPYTKIN